MILRKVKEIGTGLVSLLVLTLEGEFSLIRECNVWGCLFEIDSVGDVMVSNDNNTDAFAEVDENGDVALKEI